MYTAKICYETNRGLELQLLYAELTMKAKTEDQMQRDIYRILRNGMRMENTWVPPGRIVSIKVKEANND